MSTPQAHPTAPTMLPDRDPGEYTRQAKLTGFWAELADALSESNPALAEQIRREVLGSWQSAGWRSGGATTPPSEGAAAWLAQGAAIVAWRRLRDVVASRIEQERIAARIKALLLEISVVHAAIRAWNCHAAFFLAPPLLQLPPVRSALDALESCARELKKIGRFGLAAEEGSLSLQVAELRLRVDRTLAETSRDWPPELLADLQAALDRIAPNRLADQLLVAAGRVRADRPDEDPRLILLRALVELLDERAIASLPEAWNALADCASSIVPGAVLMRGKDPEGEGYDPPEEGHPDRPVTLLRTGLVIEDVRGRVASVVLRGRLRRPKRRPELAVALRRFHAALADQADPLGLGATAAELAVKVEAAGSAPAWWEALITPDGQDARLAEFWYFFQKVTAQAGVAHPTVESLALLSTLEAEGFLLVDLPRAAAGHEGPWRLLTDQSATETAPLVPGGLGLGLRTPDGRVLEPTAWLRVPAIRVVSSPIVKTLINTQPLAERLRHVDPGWPGWSAFEGTIWSVAYGSDAAVDATDARAAFEALYARAKDGDDSTSRGFGDLARALHAALALVPSFDLSPKLDNRLAAVPITSSTVDGIDLRWVDGNTPAGTVVRVVRFGSRTARAEVEVSRGPNFPQRFVAWLDLPPPPTAPGGSPPPENLRKWYRDVRLSPFSPDQIEETESKARGWFKTWVVEEAGLTWFHEVASKAVAGEAVGAWLDQLTLAGWCELWPRRVSGRFIWPVEHSTGTCPAGISWEYSTTVEEGQAIQVDRYAADRDHLRGVFSLGVQRADSTLGHAGAIREAAELLPALGGPAESIYVASRDRRVKCATAFDPTALVIALIDPLPRLAGPGASAAFLASVDRVLAAARGWCLRNALEILPRGWTFSGGQAVPDAGTDAPVRFGVEAAGTTQIERLGLAKVVDGAGGPPIRKPSLVRSAGLEPDGWSSLIDRLRAGEHPNASYLVSSLKNWPRIRFDDPDGLRGAGMELFESFWRPTELTETAPAEALASAVNGLLRSIGLETYPVEDITRHRADEVRVVSHGPRNTGRVATLIRPGLRSGPAGGSSILFPALVKTE